jgi:hypothetical protein
MAGRTSQASFMSLVVKGGLVVIFQCHFRSQLSALTCAKAEIAAGELFPPLTFTLGPRFSAL